MKRVKLQQIKSNGMYVEGEAKWMEEGTIFIILMPVHFSIGNKETMVEAELHVKVLEID